MTAQTLPDEVQRNLAKAMTRVGQNHPNLDAGYTYIGQLIAHDIVPSTLPNPESRVVTKELNLDSIYGAGDDLKDLLDDDGKFLIHPATGDRPEDVLRSLVGKALIPEERNDENTIVAQLHLFWQKFHNFLIDEEHADNAGQAQKLTTLVCQLVIVEDYLRQILAPTVYEDYFHNNDPTRWLMLDRLSIPQEFSRAAYRFGHSMARPQYKHIGKAETHTKLAALFRRNEALTSDFEVDWPGFFGWPKISGTQNSMRIDPWITETLSTLPNGDDITTDLILRNIEAGETLPTGISYVNSILHSTNGDEIVENFGLTALPNLGALEEKVNGLDSIDSLPLWPYVLLEASEQMDGQKLGPLGSMICAEVLRHSIEGAANSIYDVDPYGIPEVLTHLGSAGGAIEKVMSDNKEYVDAKRPFCMRHIVELMATSERSNE